MIKYGWRLFSTYFLLLTLLVLTGCGNTDGTNGKITLAEITTTDLTDGTYYVATSAVFIQASGVPMANTEISYAATFAGSSTITKTGKLYSDNTGKIPIGPWRITQEAVPVIVTIRASIGGLSDSKVVIVPASVTQ